MVLRCNIFFVLRTCNMPYQETIVEIIEGVNTPRFIDEAWVQ